MVDRDRFDGAPNTAKTSKPVNNNAATAVKQRAAALLLCQKASRARWSPSPNLAKNPRAVPPSVCSCICAAHKFRDAARLDTTTRFRNAMTFLILIFNTTVLYILGIMVDGKKKSDTWYSFVAPPGCPRTSQQHQEEEQQHRCAVLQRDSPGLSYLCRRCSAAPETTACCTLSLPC